MHAVLKNQKHKATVRGQEGTVRGRQVSDKNNKYGTYCGGSKANGKRWPDLLIVKGEDFKADFTHSWTEGRDGQGEKITLPDAFVAGQYLPGKVAVTSNGGMNAELFWEHVQTMVLPCYPTTKKGHDEVVLHFDGDESHWLKGSQHRELQEKGFHVIAPKPNTTTDTQWADLVCFPDMQGAVRVAVSQRQRLLARLPFANRRGLGPQDAVAIITPAIIKGMSERQIRKAWNEAGQVPFTRRPLVRAIYITHFYPPPPTHTFPCLSPLISLFLPLLSTWL
jgi:hypothetical protein